MRARARSASTELVREPGEALSDGYERVGVVRETQQGEALSDGYKCRRNGGRERLEPLSEVTKIPLGGATQYKTTSTKAASGAQQGRTTLER